MNLNTYRESALINSFLFIACSLASYKLFLNEKFDAAIILGIVSIFLFISVYYCLRNYLRTSNIWRYL
jgi:hypothetical protein